jgi:hypothetical protein
LSSCSLINESRDIPTENSVIIMETPSTESKPTGAFKTHEEWIAHVKSLIAKVHDADSPVSHGETEESDLTDSECDEGVKEGDTSRGEERRH